MATNREQRRAYAEAFREALKAAEVGHSDEPGREFLYRRRELLCSLDDLERVLDALRRVLPNDAEQVEVDQTNPDVARLVLSSDVRVPDAVAALRDPRVWRDDRVPLVQPHHVTVGYPIMMGHPGQPPLPASPPAAPDAARAHVGRGVTVGVCDTGIWSDAAAEHAGWYAGVFAPESDDVDPLGSPPGHLAMQAGHGTFVGGIVRQEAPGVRLDPERALEPSGLGDELMLASALASLEPGVEIVNLSLGCQTMDNIPSLPVVRALQRLCRDVVVVAAAGNSGSQRPHWPAALKGVIGVAALRVGKGGTLLPDPDSSYGPWVDACAVGTHTSTFVRGTSQLPGVGTATYDPPYAEWSGTSFAAPVVCARIAELMTRHGVPAREAARILLDHPRWHPDYGVLVP